MAREISTWTLIALQVLASAYILGYLCHVAPEARRRVTGIVRNWQGIGLHDAWLIRRLASLAMEQASVPGTLIHYEESRFRRNVAAQAAWRIIEAAREHGLGSQTEAYLVARRAVGHWHYDIGRDRDVTDAERAAASDLARFVVEQTVTRYLEVVGAGRTETPSRMPEVAEVV